MTTPDVPLWEPERPPPTRYRVGETRRALDRDIRAAEAGGRTFLETEVAAIRRQANDIDRLEGLLSTEGAKPWDYTPKTNAHIAYRDAVRSMFGTADEGDPFSAALDALIASDTAQSGTPAPLDTEDR